MRPQYNRFLKIHGILLICLGSIMTIQTLLGYHLGVGALVFLKNETLRSVGLFEAYLLAAFCGFILVVLSGKYYSKQWHLLGAGIHMILFVTNVVFWKAYAQADIVIIGYVATLAHAVLIFLETRCYYILARQVK